MSKTIKKFKVIQPNKIYSVEHLSKNIITSNNVNTFLSGELKQELDIDRSLPKSTLVALEKYFSKILNTDVFPRVPLRNSVQPLSNNEISIINEPEINFLHSNENNLITLLLKTSNNILDVLSYSLGYDIQKNSIEEIQKELLTNYSENYINNIINGKIIEVDLPETINRNYYLPKEVYDRIIDFYNILINLLSEKLNINLLFYIPTKYISDPKLTTFYISDFKNENKTIGIKIVIPFLSKIPKKTISDRELVTNIYYENMCELNSNTNTIQNHFSESIVKKIKGELSIDLGLSDEIFSPGDKLYFNPLDREGNLKVVEIQISKNLKKKFLLGRTGNLYEDDDDANDLVGNLVFTNKTTFDAKIFWSKGYIEGLTSN